MRSPFLRLLGLPLFALASLAIGMLHAASGNSTVTNPGGGKWKSGGTWDAGVPTPSANAVIASGSTATFDSGDAVSVNSLKLLGTGHATGTSSLTVTGSGSTWEGGALTGTALGTLNIGTGANMTLNNGSKTLSSWQLTNQGSVNWTGGNIHSGNGAAITNTSTFSTDFDGALMHNQGGAATVFTNSGTFSKTNGSGGATQLGAIFNNTGTVNISAGTLQLSGGGASSGNVTLGNAAAKLQLASANYQFNDGSSLNGSGIIEVASANTQFTGNVSGSAKLHVVGGSATVSGNTSLGGGSFSSGTLDGGGNLTLTGPATLSGTTITGNGVLNANGGVAITSQFSLRGNRTINLNGTSNWTGGTLYSGEASVLNVVSGATFNTAFDASLQGAYYSGATTLNNQGTFAKTAGTGTASIQAVFNNSGALDVQSGTLSLASGGAHSGAATIAPGATLALSGGTHAINHGAQFNGTGSLHVSAGNAVFTGTNSGTANIVLSGGTATFNGTTTTTGGASLTGGTLDGTGNLTTNGTVVLAGSTLTGPGHLNADGGASITGQVSMNGTRSLNLKGSSQWTGGTIYGGGASVLNINSGATFNAAFDGSFQGNHFTGGATTLNNQGTFAKTAGTGTASIQAVFNNQNSGAVNVQSGTLSLQSGGAHSGTATIASGATLALSGGTHAINHGAQFNGAGSLHVSAGNAVFSGTNSGTANIVLSGGSATFNGTTTTSGGASLTGGTLDGTGNLTASGTVVLSGSTLTGPGHLNADGGASITSQFSMNGTRSLNLKGTSNWSGGTIHGGGGSSLTIKSGASLHNSFDGSLYGTYYGGGSTVLTNEGTFAKTGGTGSTTLSGTLLNANSATIDVQSGTLEHNGSGQHNGTIHVAPGAAFAMSGGTHTFNHGAQLNGSGSVRVSGGSATFTGTQTGTATLAVTSGEAIFDGNTTTSGGGHFAGGTLRGSGNVTLGNLTTLSGGVLTGPGHLNANGGVNIAGQFELRGGRALNLGGASTWNGGYIYAGEGSTVTVQPGATFSAATDSGLNGTYHGGGAATTVLHNQGTFSKTAGTGTTEVGAVLNNTGALNVHTGTLKFSKGGSSNGTINIHSGATFLLADGLTVANAAHVSGAGVLRLDGGSLDLAGTLGVDTFAMHGGRLTGSQAFNKTVNWHGGDWDATTPGAATTIAAGATLNLASGTHDFNYRTIENAAGGTVYWQSGYLRSGNGGGFVNRGNFFDKNEWSYTAYNPGLGGSFTFTNHGTYTRDVGGSSTFDVPFQNHGTIHLTGGDIHLRGGGTMFGASVVHAAAGSHLYISDNFTLAPGAQFLGAGAFVQTAGTLTIDGPLNASSFHWNGGNWNAPASGVTTTIAAGTTLHIAHGGDSDFHRRNITVAAGGVVNWHSGHLRSGNDGAFVNQGIFNDENFSGYSIFNPGAGAGFGGNFTFTNAGIYNKMTTGTTHVQVPFNNSGTLNIAAGTLVFGSSFITSGAIHLGANAQAHFPAGFTTHASLTGNGTIHAASVTAGGLVSPGLSPGTLTITGDLTLLNTSTLLIELGGPTQGADYDHLSIGGSAFLGGTLALNFTNGYQHSVLPTDTFTILAGAGLTGSFANIGSGQRLVTNDGFGSFQVNYGLGSAFAANSVVLSNFQAIPEPSTYALLGLGACVVLAYARRRR